MAVFEALLGPTLKTKVGTTDTAAALDGKVVALYFSAHWCPPCRGFTPQLAQWYQQNLEAKGLEVVFISSDKSEAEFENYFGEQPWKALPFSDRDRKQALSKKFKVQGIPTLIILDNEGKIITTDGRSAVSSDPTGEDFPWRPKPFHQVLGTTFVGKDGPVDAHAVAGKVLGIYFSAHWCPPCRGFTPKLAAWYHKMKDANLNFEVVFASSDRSASEFQEYYAEMPWLAIPYDDRKRKEELSNLFGVEGIPTFVIVDVDGTTITTNGRGIPTRDPEGTQFPWHPKPVHDLAEDAESLNTTTSVVVLAEELTSEEQKAVEAALTPLAVEHRDRAKASGEDPAVLFFVGTSVDGPAARIRQLCKLPTRVGRHEHPLAKHQAGAWGCDGCGGSGEDRYRCTAGCDFDYCGDCYAKANTESAALAPAVLILDIPDRGGFYVSEAASAAQISTDSIRQFLAQYSAHTLDRKQLQ